EKSVSVNNNDPILLYVDEGDVSYKLPGETSFIKATTSPREIETGTYVYTGVGEATVLFPNNSSVALDTYTELLVKYDEQHVSLFQTLGTTYHRVEALVTGATYEVETPGTLAAVRGTKFAVKYDKKKKETKVSVTEHTVRVSRFDETSTSTQERTELETKDIQEGTTVQVHASTTATSTSAFTTVQTKEDEEMNSWVEKNTIRDAEERQIKETISNKEQIREALKDILIQREDARDVLIQDINKEDIPSREIPKEQVVPVREVKKTVDDTSITKPQVSTTTKPVVKLDEEVFFDKFTTMFVNYLYLDEKDTPCSLSLGADERVKFLTSFATQSGYPFTSTTLLSFAQEVDRYCKAKDPNLKAKLQSRFDAEFPFQESL
ncbi:MAG: FecR protein, partial [Candidatus Parcubacteria bacterium]